MSITNRALLILALLAASTAARSDGIGFNPVTQIEGISFKGSGGGGGGACTNQLNFSVACNSQYLTIVH